MPLHDVLRGRAAEDRAGVRGMRRAHKAEGGQGRHPLDERIHPRPRVQGPAEGEALRRKGQQALRPQQADPRRHRMQIRGGSHGLQRQAGRHADRHGRALRRGHEGELLLDPHADRNGPEFINYAMAEMQGKRQNIAVSRSRFYRKNDNAHVEQKNGSVVRELFGELRLDCLDLEGDLRRLEAEWSDYCNFFRPTKMIVAKIKKPDGKGYVRKYQEGGPRTPYQRVLESGILGESESGALKKRYESMNGIQLYQQIVRRLKRILRRQESWREQHRQSQRLLQEARLADSALRAAPSGASASPGLLDGAVDLRPRPLGTRQRKLRSVQQLTNQKNKRQLQGARPT